MNSDAFLSLLQFTDGLFPIGSYAHSFGLEAYASDGKIRDAHGVERFLLSYLEGSAAPTDAVAALASRKAAGFKGTAAIEQCAFIDHSLDALKAATELRDASRQMGRQVLRIAADLGGPFASQGLAAYFFRAVENEETPGHHAMAFGVVAGALGWPEAETARAYLYSTCAGLAAASLRLLSLGQLAGQRMLWALLPSITRLADEVRDKRFVDIWSFTPGIEIASMRHATLDARLFRS